MVVFIMQRTLGQTITFYREQLGLSQKELAQKLNIGKSTMSQYESDERRPSDEIKLQLCDIFSISLDELLGRKFIVQHTMNDNKKIPKDLKKILEDEAITLNDRMLSEEDKEKMYKIIEAAFWEAKEMNKRKK
jgi:transcriptional regulator with XRE-family HTH domain